MNRHLSVVSFSRIRTRRNGQEIKESRRGFLLIIVLAVLVLLSLACYEYADRTTSERAASAKMVQLAEARMAALSGIDVVLAAVSDPEFSPAAFEDMSWLIEQPLDETGRLGFSVLPIGLGLGAWPDDPAATTFGMVSESGKVNLNALAEAEDSLTEEDQREVLVQLPNMTESIADTILDFIDADGTPRTFGTESDSGEVVIRNRPLDSLDDLLALPEVDSVLLYGTDFDFNGRLDESEFVESSQIDPGPGLATYVTVFGREANVSSTGDPRIDVNQDDLTVLENDLAGSIGDDVASFVRRYREEGSSQAQQNQQLFARISNRFGPLAVSNSGDLTGEIQTLADLIDATVGGDNQSSPLVSTDLDRLLQFYDVAATTDATTISGRIDINSASTEVLVAVAGLEESTASAIAERNDWTHPVELLTTGLLDITTYRRIEPLLTSEGRVFSFSSIGYVTGGPMVRIDAIVDASLSPPRVLRQVDMTRLGIGRTLEMVRPSMLDDVSTQ